jgi:DNA-binding protein H-NS
MRQSKRRTNVAETDLNTMSLDDLLALRADIEKALRTFERRKKAEAIAAARARAKEFGFKLEELIDEASSKSRRATSAPKYRHPENPEVTWTGRGRRPDWIREALESGKSLDDFAI